MRPPGEFFKAGGRSTHVLRRGSGSPVVIFEAGAGQVSSTWLPVLDGVAQFTTACTWDRPGYGWSQKSDPPLDLDSVCARLADVLEAAELEPPYVLVGWSLGAFYVRRFAHLHASGVAGIVLVDPSHERMLDGISTASSLAQRAVRRFVGGAPALVSRLAKPRVSREAERLFPQLPATDRAELVRVITRPGSLRVQFAEQARVLKEAQSLPVWPGVLGSTPLTVLAAGKMPGGERFRQHRDGVQLPELTALSSIGELRVAPDADHGLPLTHPALVVDAVRHIVDQVRRDRTTIALLTAAR